jgi:segregation and condensation protein A
MQENTAPELSENLEKSQNPAELVNGEIEDSTVQEGSENVDLLTLIEQPEWKTILIGLVKREKMDPWDIDIAELADKYLQKINSLSGSDLRLPANAILASAILLKFKSRILKLSSLDKDEEELSPEEFDSDEAAILETMLPDLQNVRKIREGKVSLDSLVEGIERMLEKSKTRRDKRFSREEAPEFKLPFSDFRIDEKVEEVFARINQRVDREGLVLFSALLDKKNVIETVETFIPCLFLTNKNKINMWQEEFFGEVFISLAKKTDQKE